ncbi:hypothetical protein [Corynebacterium sp.]|uniref:hypothetical protein n=1 Tax=Corynebacterium sp. TaxID=1720 RepID=UPI0026DBC14E|nr:hypothetical protein [Corynebacterium sp.]MDO5075710.1 hypothetical protein [Corynebacterium sp.]
MTHDLPAIGMEYPRWQDAVEAAIATGKLEVIGEVRGGQLIQYADASGARVNILAVSPYATWTGFESTTNATAHISMINDVLALCDILAEDDSVVTSLTCNLAQGPLLVEEPTQQFERLALTALGLEVATFADAAEFHAAHGRDPEPMIVSQGALLIASGSGAQSPDASAALTGTVHSAEYRTNELTGQRFIHVRLAAPHWVDLCLADGTLPAPGSIVAGTVVLTGSILPPVGCGDSCGSCGGGCSSGHL